ncbi:MAG: radical SAM protein [Candidatus Moraniibacteriota bacterium]
MQKLILRGSAQYLHLAGSKFIKSEIDYIMLNLPFECNYQCLKCCNRFREYNLGNLSLTKIKESILRLQKVGAKVLVIAGEGEPVINKNFRAIVKFANKNKLIPYIFTNGSVINEKLAKFLAQNNASLIINMDSFEEEKYNHYVNKKGAYKNLIKNIKVIRKIYTNNIYSYHKSTVVSLAINLVLNNENYKQIEKIKKFCGDDIVFVVNKPIDIGSASKNNKKYNKVKNIIIDKDVSYPLGTLVEGRECSYMKNGISIGSDGKILTCAYALETQNLYGDIFNSIEGIGKKVLKSVNDFYKKYGFSRCILRHPKYHEFIRFTEEQNEKNRIKSRS